MEARRAGHAHAGVIILLSLIGQVLADNANLPVLLAVAVITLAVGLLRNLKTA